MAVFPLLVVLLLFALGCFDTWARAARPRWSFGTQNQAMVVICGLLTTFIVLYFYVVVLPPFRPYAYADDWIYALPLKFSSVDNWIDWAFAQHVDHRIPIQKITNFLILRAAGFDFRYMVGVNYLMGVSITIMMLYLGWLYRGFFALGDLLIPMAILNYGVGYSLWGFEFCFLSTVFFFALFLVLGFRYAKVGRVGLLNGGTLALIACAFTGFNGVIPATFATIAMLGWTGFAQFRARSGRLASAIALLTIALLVELGIWMSWQPTAATNLGGVGAARFARYVYGLVPASMVVFSYRHIWWKFLTVALLFAGAMGICLHKLFRRALTLEDFLLALGALCSLVTIAAVAFGRSRAQGDWNPVLGMHYGFLSVLMPVLSWIVVSKRTSPQATAWTGLFLAGVFLLSFCANLEWRLAVIASKSAHQAEIVKAMEHGENPKRIADEYLLDFTIDAEHENDVTSGIEAFRADGARLYGARR